MKRKVLLAQLPIPPAGIEPIEGNVPLAAGYLKMYARNQGLELHYDIEILPTAEANLCGDLALVEAILSREPWMVGFTCYLWNIQRTLWICERLKQRCPELLIVLGGPEITSDNNWVLQHAAVDYAAIGEGEQTFSELLTALVGEDVATLTSADPTIAGLYIAPPVIIDAVTGVASRPLGMLPVFRKPLPQLKDISSPYLEGILDAADEQMLLLETIRGCIFNCKFCYYPKSYDALYFLSQDKIEANLRHASQRGVREVVLLDPTLNQKRDFAAFLRLLARCNPEPRFKYFGELRAEGINAEIARLLREANFTDVEIGLQSVDPLAMDLMDRKNNMKAFERGVRAMLDEGIRVKVDLIIGLPGDTVDSVRRGMHYIRDTGLYSEVQVFNLAILPGTAFRHEAETLGLKFQDRPPYYVLETPTMNFEQMYDLMAEAQEIFETEFDPLPELTGLETGGWRLEAGDVRLGLIERCRVDLNTIDVTPAFDAAVFERLLGLPAKRSQAFTLSLTSSDFDLHRAVAVELVERLLMDNPHTTLQIVLRPFAGSSISGSYPVEPVSINTLEAIRRACYANPTYLDRFYAVLPGPSKGAKRIVIALTAEQNDSASDEWRDAVADYGTLVVYRSSNRDHSPVITS